MILVGIGTVYAYTGSADQDPGSGPEYGGGGDDDDGGTGGGTGEPGNCVDGNDNDENNGADGNDPFSCVLPLEADDIEGSIWDTDMTTTMEGESPSLSETESVFFSGEVRQGNDNTESSNSDSGTLTEYSIVDLQSESDGYYGYGRLNSISFDSFPSGTDFNNGRAIDPPNNYDGSDCGDGIENEGLSKNGNTGGSTSSTTNCREDYGRVNEKYDQQENVGTEDPYNDKNTDGMRCRDDEVSCNNADVWCEDGDDTYPACDPESSCSGGVDTFADCEYTAGDTDTTLDSGGYADDTGNYFWETSGDDIYREECTEDSGTVDSTSDSCGADTYYSTEDECIDYNETSDECDEWSYTCTSDDGDECSESTSDSLGDYRSWEETDRETCNDNNVVDGGGDAEGHGQNKIDNDPAGTFTDFTAHADDSWGGSDPDDGQVWCGYDSTLTVDADGPQGQGDGFVVIHDGSVVATEGPGGGDTVGQRVYVDGSNSGNDYRNKISATCPGDKTTCMKYVDYVTVSGSGTQGSPEWTTIDGAVSLNSGATETYTADESYSVCKNINRINEKNGDGTELIDCDYERGSDGSEDISPLPEAGGDEPNEQLIMMEGSEVDDSISQNYLAFEQKVIDWDEDTGAFGGSLDSNACVSRGVAVSEGTVAPIQSYNLVPESFENGVPSPDWEVCLNIEESESDTQPWDNVDNDKSLKDYGGEWYDLDDEKINDYLRGTGSDLITNGDQNNPNDIAWYWRENPNPQHPTYNPTGGREGVAIEDDCDPALEGCDTTGTSMNNQGLFFGNFTDFSRDEDYHPQTENSAPPYGMDPLLTGHLKKIKEDSDQLEPGMTPQNSLDFSDPDNYWVDSRGGEDYADQYGYVDQRSDAISNRGNSKNPNTGQDYVPGSTYARTSSAIRGSVRSNSVPKTQKVFGNSIVVESTSSGPFNEGEGYWLDPDNLESSNGDFKSDWWDIVRFNIDITGPDSGLGWDDGSDPSVANYDKKQSDSVIRGGIYWEEEYIGGSPYHERPMCGDDQSEFLVEEIGESVNPSKGDGRYACTVAKNKCITFADDPPVADKGEYRQGGEPDEDVGRLKNDEEICLQDRPDEQSKWWDQDYGDVTGDGVQDTCNVNGLYGDAGIRWIDKEYVQTHPEAVTGGIDDDWNGYIQQEYESGRTDRHVSEPSQDSWNFDSESPVPSGARAVGNDSIATLGFCGGDDDGEYLVTQQCNSNLCETNRTVIGVAKNPDSCVIDEETMSYNTNVDERTVMQPGSEVDVKLSGETRELTCFNNQWFGNYPIVFNQEKVEVPFGDSATASFSVINVREESTTFEVEMVDPITDDPSAYQHSTFVDESGDSFETTVSPQSSETFYINIEGSNKAIGDSSESSEDDLKVRASAVNSEMSGEDSTTVEVVENNATNSSVGRTEPQSVPGIGAVHVMALILISSAVFFLQS